MKNLSHLILSGIVAVSSIARADEPSNTRPDPAVRADSQEPRTLPPLAGESARIAEELEGTLPAGSEARAMLEDILRGSRLGPGEGWFRLAVSQTRFEWPAVKKRYDANDDDSVSAEEFGGEARDFVRLDRDGDGRLSAADLSWKEDFQTRDAGSALFRLADANGDSRVTPDEFSELFAKFDEDAAGFITLDDMRSRFSRGQATAGRRSGGGPDRDTLLRGLVRQEIGSLQPGPALNDPAPDFTLSGLDGGRQVTLSETIGPRPVVLVFGNFTCGPFRGAGGEIEKLYRRYKDRATFLMVYVREAHPTDGWHMESNERVGVSLEQPKTYASRADVAARCRDQLGFGMPVLVDTLDDAVGAVYSGMPSRLYVIDAAGKVAYKSGRGPFGFKPSEMEQSLVLLLAEAKTHTTVSAD